MEKQIWKRARAGVRVLWKRAREWASAGSGDASYLARKWAKHTPAYYIPRNARSGKPIKLIRVSIKLDVRSRYIFLGAGQRAVAKVHERKEAARTNLATAQ